MKKITLTKHYGGWMAKFEGDPEILEMFGTDTIPTAFTRFSDEDEVFETVRRLNPRFLVVKGDNHAE
ncbi:MAG: hypothetical protein ACRCZI_10335 [Cetobacterium sp.]